MNILFDGRVYQTQQAGGISRYFTEIISGLPANYHPLLTGVGDFGNHRPSHPNLEQPYFKHFRPGRISVRWREKWWKPRLLRRVDLLHPTYYDLTSGYLLDDFKCPIVTTVYDMIYARFPTQMEGSATVIQNQRDSVLSASHVVCISKSTEIDLLELIPEADGKTSVIHLGSSFEVQTPLPEEATFEKPYFLFVGGRAGYKNFQFLLRAFAMACELNPVIRLRVAGAPLNGEERWMLYLLGINDRVESVVYPEEEDLLALYRSSVALLYPSVYEGFGIPALEAMAARTLAITSNTSSLPEVVGDGGVMLDPKEEEAWVECILKVAGGGGDRSRIIERGVERVQTFSWKSTVAQHLAIYHRLSQSR